MIIETHISQKDRDRIETGIRSKYVKVAHSPKDLFNYPTGRAGLDGLNYDSERIRALPEKACSSVQKSRLNQIKKRLKLPAAPLSMNFCFAPTS